ncbi:hypothetical protein ACEUZ9_000083 [Paracoccus litorisediminis]|uniref:spike base protein, RCAP_Rcc01079 family n=1 Tax=Paracoccus litorisediminis TaxID=2006130 RepID=UPI00373443B5
MPANRFSAFTHGTNAPALGAVAVTPNDNVDLAEAIRAVTVNVSGTLSFIGLDGVIYTTAALPVGTYAVSTARIRATGTTASAITGWV